MFQTLRAAALLLCLNALFVQAKVLRVDPTAGIKQSLALLQTGDSLLLSAGTYSGSDNCDLVLKNLNDVTILGVGRSMTIIDCQLKSRCLSILNCTGVVIDGIW